MRKNFFLKENKELLKYFNKSNVKKYYVKKSINISYLIIFNNFLYNKEI